MDLAPPAGAVWASADGVSSIAVAAAPATNPAPWITWRRSIPSVIADLLVWADGPVGPPCDDDRAAPRTRRLRGSNLDRGAHGYAALAGQLCVSLCRLRHHA